MCRSILIQSSFSFLLVLMLLIEVNRESLILHSVTNCVCLERAIRNMSTSTNETKRHLPVVAVCGKLLPLDARVVEWQTRTFEGRMPKGLRVQVPPRAFPC